MKPVWWSCAAGFFSGLAVSAIVVLQWFPQRLVRNPTERVAQIAIELQTIKAGLNNFDRERSKLWNRERELQEELSGLTGIDVKDRY